MCDKTIHEELINIGDNICPFCEIVLINVEQIEYKCCEKKLLYDVDGIKVCIFCGQVDSCIFKCDYFNFYENMFKIKRKSIYIRKYHIEKLINNLLVNYNYELTHKQRTQIYKIFESIGFILKQINKNRKRIISVKYLLQRIFDMMNIKYNIFFIKSIKTLNFYNSYWEKIMTLIGDDIKSILV